jgi:UDP-N-acetylmuramate dehydrogenase
MNAMRTPASLPEGVLEVEAAAPIATWFGVGGRADRLVRPRSAGQLVEAVRLDPALRVVGDGANLLVDDDGVSELVVAFTDAAFTGVEIDARTGRVSAGAGANLPKLILETVRAGLGGLETLGGIPASVGGAIVMNAGGAFGEIGPSVAGVHGVDRAGREVFLAAKDIAFGYRRSGLNDLILTSVEFALTPGDPAALRAKLKDVMEYKKKSQPMGERSAGCVFKNPTLAHDLRDIGAGGTRVSAGMLIDRAGLKGLSIGGASVSDRHANFVVTRDGATAGQVIELMREVRRRVADTFGVTLEPEVVIWSRRGGL